MKTSILFFVISAILFSSAKSQVVIDTLVINHANSFIKDARVWSINPDDNNSTGGGIELSAWTVQQEFSLTRAYIDFDWSMLPENAEIINAKLRLFNRPNSGVTGGEHNKTSGSNEFVVRRIVSSWGLSTITWNNQPNITSTNEVIVPETSSPHQDFEIEVTELLIDMLNSSSQYGFALRLLNETTFRSIVIASSYEPDINIRPEIEIVYQLSNTSTSELEGDIVLEDFKVYPNPLSNNKNLSVSFNINKNHSPSIRVLDIYKREVDLELIAEHNPDYTHSYSLNTSQLSSGVYFIELNLDGKQLSYKKLAVY